MSLWRRIERRWLGLPAARSAVLETETWMKAADGARLATRVLRPADPAVRRGTALIRSERPIGSGGPLEGIARWLAEDGRTVLYQSCRGRDRSEGTFRPFLDERSDGRDALRWATSQPGFDDRLVLVGLGYAAFAACAANAAAPEAVAGVATGFGARDPYAWLYPGGALQLEVALALAARLDGRYGIEPRHLDLPRAGRHRPLGECDRVAVRELSAFRAWIAHPERDAWWEERTPALTDAATPSLFLGGLYEGSLSAALADYRALAERAARDAADAPNLVLGPWGAAPLQRGERLSAANPIAAIARALLSFAARIADAGAPWERRVRVFASGVGWRESVSWPPTEATPRTLYLRGDRPANSAAGGGRLAPEPPGDEPADAFVADPSDPVPSRGGVAIGALAGRVDQRPVEARGDVLCFTGDPLSEPLELAGDAWLELYGGAPGERALLCAKLVAVAPDGAARWLGEGALRVTPADGGALRVGLGAVAAFLPAGVRLRLEVSGSSVPRFARADGENARALRHRLYHDAERPSALHFAGLGGRPDRGRR